MCEDETWIASAISIVVVLTIFGIILGIDDYFMSEEGSDVYEELDRYGGYIYLTEISGNSNILVKWYAAPESNISVGGGYLHVCKAALYSGYSLDNDVYIPLGQILYIQVNNH